MENIWSRRRYTWGPLVSASKKERSAIGGLTSVEALGSSVHMPKKLFRRLALSPEKLREIRSLRPLGDWVYEPNLWHINRTSTANAFAIGLFCAMVPAPGQMFVAAFFAVRLRANLPLSVSLIFVTNPLTMPVIYFAAYKLGALLLGTEVREVEFAVSWSWLTSSLGHIWEPFLLGCLVMGIAASGLGWLLVNQLWRWRVGRDWRKRQRQRRQS